MVSPLVTVGPDTRRPGTVTPLTVTFVGSTGSPPDCVFSGRTHSLQTGFYGFLPVVGQELLVSFLGSSLVSITNDVEMSDPW